MSALPISMRKFKEVLRLKHEAGLSQRQIGERASSIARRRQQISQCRAGRRDHLAAAGRSQRISTAA
jgi:hypothetical protein